VQRTKAHLLILDGPLEALAPRWNASSKGGGFETGAY